MFSDFHISNQERYKYPLFVDGKQVYGCSFLFEWDEPLGYFEFSWNRIERPGPQMLRVWLTKQSKTFNFDGTWKHAWIKYREITGHELLAMDVEGIIYEYDGEKATMTQFKEEEEE